MNNVQAYDKLRLLTQCILAPSADSSMPMRDLQLVPGRLPEGLRVQLPLPEGARIVGSAIFGQEEVEILLDVPASPEQVLAFYWDQLVAWGWERLTTSGIGPIVGPYPGPSFHRPDGDPAVEVFCAGYRGPELHISAGALPERPTDVRLRLSATPFDSAGHYPHYRAPDLPKLQPPPGAVVTGGGIWGIRGVGANPRRRVETSMSLEAIDRHYQQQLAGVGWHHGSGGRTAWVAWSTWAFQDVHGIPRRALLVILRRPLADGTYDWSLSASALDRRNLPAASLVAGGTQAAARDAPGLDGRLLYELAHRVIVARLARVDQAPRTLDVALQLLPGQLDRAFATVIPLLGGSIAGSVLHGGGAIAVVEINLNCSHLVGFFHEYLIATGWKVVPSTVPLFGGFIHPPRPGTQLCFARDGSELKLRLWPRGGGTLVGAGMKTADHPAAMQRHLPGTRRTATLLPRLISPPHATIITGSARYRATWQRSNTSFQVDADLWSVSTHYAEELRLAGWRMREAARDDLFAWHCWTFRDRSDQQWQALFYVLRRPDAVGDYVLELEATRVSGEGWEPPLDSGSKVGI